VLNRRSVLSTCLRRHQRLIASSTAMILENGTRLRAHPGPRRSPRRRRDAVDRAGKGLATRQSELGVVVKRHPCPPSSMGPKRPTASKVGRIEPQQFITCVGTTARARWSYWAVSAGTPGIGVTRTVPGKMTSPTNTMTGVCLPKRRQSTFADLHVICGKEKRKREWEAAGWPPPVRAEAAALYCAFVALPSIAALPLLIAIWCGFFSSGFVTWTSSTPLS
jgi:hypothetical protein